MLSQNQRDLLAAMEQEADPETGLVKMSMGAMGELMGWKSSSQVYGAVTALVLKGYIERIQAETIQEGNSYKIIKSS